MIYIHSFIYKKSIKIKISFFKKRYLINNVHTVKAGHLYYKKLQINVKIKIINLLNDVEILSSPKPMQTLK